MLEIPRLVHDEDLILAIVLLEQAKAASSMDDLARLVDDAILVLTATRH